MKKLLEGSSCIKWLLQHNRSCPEKIAASVRSLRHSDWCCKILWTKVRWQNLMAVNFNVIKMYSYRWKNGFLRLFYRYTYSTFKRTHRQNQFWEWTYCGWKNYSNNERLQVLLSKEIRSASKNRWLTFFMWQKQIHYFQDR